MPLCRREQHMERALGVIAAVSKDGMLRVHLETTTSLQTRSGSYFEFHCATVLPVLTH